MKAEETQRQKDKKRKLNQFNIDKIDDFIKEKNKKQFGHICDKCNKRFRCDKAKNSIVLKCSEFEQKQYQNKNDNYRKRNKWAK